MIDERITHGGRAISISRKYNIPLDKILDFSSNTNPLGYSKKIDKLSIADFNLTNFPDDTYPELIATISKNLRCKTENILVGNGTTEIIRMISNAFINDKTRVGIQKYTYGEYAYSTKLCKGQIAQFNFSSDYDLVFLCNPNNPTGEIVEQRVIQNFLDNYKGIFVLDEAYIEFLDDEVAFSLSKFIDKYDNLIILRSLSKFYGLPGIRLGYCLANKKIIHEINRWRISWNVNSFAVKIGITSLNDTGFECKTKKFIAKERRIFFNSLKEFHANDSATTYFLIKVKNSEELCGNLEKKGILIRDCNNFGLKNYIRVSLRKRDENKRLVELLK